MNQNPSRAGSGIRLLFTGDSITDADHLWEPGEDGLGSGFVSMIGQTFREYSGAGRLKYPVTVINSGYNGFRAEDLERRFTHAVLEKNPDVVTLLIGVNEAGAAAEGMVTPPEVFENTYRKMIEAVTGPQCNARMILMEPFLFGKPAYLKNWRPYFETLLPVIGKLAAEYSLPYIRLDQPLNSLAEEEGIDRITVDGIHLTETGNRYLAERWIETFRKNFTEYFRA